MVDCFKSVEDSLAYASHKDDFAPTAVPWILEYYQQAHPDWTPGPASIPLIVDLGCGSGQLSVPLAEYCERLIGVDLSPHQVDVARRVSARPNIEYKVGSATELSSHCPQGGVDLIAVGMGAQFFDNDEFYAEVKRCLRPGGVLALVGYDMHGIQHEDEHFRTIFDQLAVDYALDDHCLNAKKKQYDSYRSLYCPLEGVKHREEWVSYKMTREEIRKWYLRFSNYFRDGERTINGLVDSLPPMTEYSVIQTAFGLFWQR